jgi:branched-chain amino acid transport system permease protein
MEYLFHLLILTAIYIILVTSLDLLVGHSGIISVAHASLFGLGAYTTALVATRYDPPFLIPIVLGMFVAGLASGIIAAATLRLNDDHFVLATFGVQSIIFHIFENWVSVTRGPYGVPGIPHPHGFGFSANTLPRMLILAGSCALLTHVVVVRLTTSPYGRVLRAIREDEVFTRSLGKDVNKFKLSAFAVGGALAALAGGLYAFYMTYIDPTSFTIMESILILSMVIVGGAGSHWGPVAGAAILVFLPEVLRFVGLPDAIAGYARQVIYGLLLILMIIFRPGGLAGGYRVGRS